MASAQINDIKARIKSVNGTMQITKAMELVATSKLRYLKERAEGVKPYMKVLFDSIEKISSALPSGESVYTSEREGKTLFIVIAGDRGLAGGYNSNILKLASALDADGNGMYIPVGKKAADSLMRKERNIYSLELSSVADAGVGECMNLARKITEGYLLGEFTKIKLIYTRFASMLTQIPTEYDVLPLVAAASSNEGEPIYEGEIEDMIERIVPQYIGGAIYAAICEASASECAARRTAMNSANKNAEEMINSLTLSFNRARQAVITQEITEIVSGAEAL